MRKQIVIIGSLLAALALVAVIAVVPAGADPTNASTTIGSNTSYSGTSSAGSSAAKGGNITEVDVSVSSQTSKWQGFYGNVSGGIQLANSGNTKMYLWSATPAGEVYASQDISVNASEWAALTTRTGAFIDGNWSFTTTDADSATNTFTLSSTAINVGSNSVSSAANSAVKTRDNGGAATWETIALGPLSATTKSQFVFVSIIRGSSTGDAYDGTTKDFQMIVPVGSGTETYYFYVELT